MINVEVLQKKTNEGKKMNFFLSIVLLQQTMFLFNSMNSSVLVISFAGWNMSFCYIFTWNFNFYYALLGILDKFEGFKF